MHVNHRISSSSATDSFAAYLQTKVFGSLDGIRALAILAVLWHHTATGAPNWPITTRGFIGVDLFFVISGFLIATLLLREQRNSGQLSLRNFYIRRFLRIFPAYYLMLLIVGATAVISPGKSSNIIMHDLFFAALYLSNMVPMNSILAITWSLSAEEQFYLLAPLVIKSLQRALLPILILAYIVVSLPPFGYFSSSSLPSFFRETTYGPILLGVILADLLNRENYYSCLRRVCGWKGAPVVAFIILLWILNYPGDDISGWHRISIHWAMLSFVATCVVMETHALQPILTFRPMQRLGKVSYGIYLYHLIAAHFVDKGIKAINISWEYSAFVGTLIATWAAAELSYRFYEAPFLSMKKRFGSSEEATQAR